MISYKTQCADLYCIPACWAASKVGYTPGHNNSRWSVSESHEEKDLWTFRDPTNRISTGYPWACLYLIPGLLAPYYPVTMNPSALLVYSTSVLTILGNFVITLIWFLYVQNVLHKFGAHMWLFKLNILSVWITLVIRSIETIFNGGHNIISDT